MEDPEQQKLQEDLQTKQAEFNALKSKVFLNQKLSEEEKNKQKELEKFITENTSKLQFQNTQIEIKNDVEINPRRIYEELIKGSAMEAQLKALDKSDAQIEQLALHIDAVVRKYYGKELVGFPPAIINGMCAGTQSAMIEVLANSGTSSSELFAATADGLSDHGINTLFSKISSLVTNVHDKMSGILGPLTGNGPLPDLAKRVENLTAFVVLHKNDMSDGNVPQLVNPVKYKELLNNPIRNTTKNFDKPQTLALFTLHSTEGSGLTYEEQKKLKDIVDNPQLKINEKTLANMEKAMGTTDKFLDKRSFRQDTFMGLFDKIRGPLSLLFGKGKNMLPSDILGHGLFATALGGASLDAYYLAKNVVPDKTVSPNQMSEQANLNTGSEKITNKDAYLQFIKKTIISHESGSTSYKAINPYDINGVSLGLLQWHRERAKVLLKRMQSQYPDMFATIMGNDFANLDNSTLRSIKRDNDKISRFEKLMDKNEFKNIMDDQADNDIKEYVEVAKSRGITEPKAIVYYANIQNKGGKNGSKGYVADKTLDGMYKAADKEFPKVYQQIQQTDFSTITV